MPGMLMIVAFDSFAAAASALASDVNVSKLPEMRSVGMLLATMSGGRNCWALPHDGDLILIATCRACEPRHLPVQLGSRLSPPIQAQPPARPSFRSVRAVRQE